MNKKFIACLSISVFSLISCNGNIKRRESHYHHQYKVEVVDISNQKPVETLEGNWEETFDEMISKSKVTTGTVRSAYLHACEDMIMDTGAICPLYYYRDVYLANQKLTGYIVCPVGFKWFDDCDYNGDRDIKVCVGPKAKTLDPAKNSTVDGGIVCNHNFEGLFRWKRPTEGVESTDVVLGAANSCEEREGENGTHIYTFDLTDGNGGWKTYWNDYKKEDASDAVGVTADDYIYSWNRAANARTASDYGYMFEYIVGYEDVAAAKDEEGKTIKRRGDEKMKGLKSLNDGKTLEVTLKTNVSFFKELCAFPTFFPVREKYIFKKLTKDDEGFEYIAENTGWWTDASTYVGNGPMKPTLINNVNNGSFEFTKNKKYYNKDLKTNNLLFELTESDDNQFMNFQSGAWPFIDTIPQGQLDAIKKTPEYHECDQIGTYYVIFNVNDQKFNKVLDTEEKYATFRKALSLLIDRRHICDSIGKAGQIPANGFVSNGSTDFVGGNPGSELKKEEWVLHSGPLSKEQGVYVRDSKNGYVPVDICFEKPEKEGEPAKIVKNENYSFKENCNKAIEMIKSVGYHFDETTKKFTDIPTITYLYNQGTGNKTIAEYLAYAFEVFGIKIKLDSQEWAVFQDSRHAGEFNIARNGWIADYTDACSFLDMWTSESGNNDCQFGRKFSDEN